MNNYKEMAAALNSFVIADADSLRVDFGRNVAAAAECSVKAAVKRFHAAFNAAVDERVSKMLVARCACLDDPEMLCCPCGGSGYVLQERE